MRQKVLGRFSALVTATLLIGGCRKQPPIPRTQALSNEAVELSQPEVKFEGDMMTVSGNVRRKPGIVGSISGRVDITVIGPGGGSLIWMPALLTPNPIPSEGLGESQYIIHYGYMPPAGSTVQAHFVDADTAKQEDIDDTEKEGTSGLRSANGEFGDKGRLPHIGINVPF